MGEFLGDFLVDGRLAHRFSSRSHDMLWFTSDRSLPVPHFLRLIHAASKLSMIILQNAHLCTDEYRKIKRYTLEIYLGVQDTASISGRSLPGFVTPQDREARACKSFKCGSALIADGTTNKQIADIQD
ncbi:hypothetical protein [Microvirga brassicacearum]|uniref:Uncharacterized protein n=1 Tax=Microvirga brassicacearum TaxID=2580413 RepID=A0A5N3PCT1_9HYPH|nr:hypothetical protein [Microvirga brassicacearum]KAB0267445.1 hypothetical protein FEZ63_09035 [Microvirga brassicacearum]